MDKTVRKFVRTVICVCAAFMIATTSALAANDLPALSTDLESYPTGGYNTSTLYLTADDYRFEFEGYIGETSPFDLNLFGWGTEKNTLSVFVLPDNSKTSTEIDGILRIDTPTNEIDCEKVWLSCIDPFNGETISRHTTYDNFTLCTLNKGVNAVTLRLRYYDWYGKYVAYRTVKFYYLLLTPAEAENYIKTEKLTFNYYTKSGTGYKVSSKTAPIAGLKKLLNTKKIR